MATWNPILLESIWGDRPNCGQMSTEFAFPGIYQFIHGESGRIYVGQAQNIRTRIFSHTASVVSTSCSGALQRAFREHGWEAFDFSVLERVDDLSLLNSREAFWIAAFRSDLPAFGYNHGTIPFNTRFSSRKRRHRHTIMNVWIQNPHREPKEYYCRFMVRGRRVKRNTNQSNEQAARRWAAALRKRIIELGWDGAGASSRRKPAGPPSGTIAALLDAYDRSARMARLADCTRINTANALGNLWKRATGKTLDGGDLITILDAELVRKWKTACLARADAEAKGDPMRRDQLLFSANRILAQARAIFTVDRREDYKREGLELPDSINGFLTEPRFRRLAKRHHSPASDVLESATFEALEGLRDTDRNLYIASWLALGFGLRKGEISQARVGWLRSVGGLPFLDGQMLTKNKNGRPLFIRGVLGGYDKLAALLVGRLPTAFIIEGTATERKELVFRRCAKWMSDLGWPNRKKIHDLRALSGSLVARLHGPIAGQKHLRHAELSTFMNSYAHHVMDTVPETRLEDALRPPANVVPMVASPSI